MDMRNALEISSPARFSFCAASHLNKVTRQRSKSEQKYVATAASGLQQKAV
jgi:hypothetical protein